MEIEKYINSKQRSEILTLLRSHVDNQRKGISQCENLCPKEYHCRKNVLLEQIVGYWRIILEDEPSQIWAYYLDLSEHFFGETPLEKITSFFKGGFEIRAKKLGLDEYPSHFQKVFSHIYTLDISENQIVELDTKQYGVYKIYANDNRITNLNASEINSSLTHLSLRNNQLQSISSDFWKNVQKIKHLDIAGNQLETLSLVLNWIDSPWRYTGRKEASLVGIDASHNQIAYLEISHQQIHDNYYSKKQTIPVFYNFKRLILHHNSLNTLPHELFSNKSNQNLQILDLSHNQFVTLPEKFSTLPKLKWFSISHNQLKNLILPIQAPLKTLLATNNFLENLPENIGSMITLEKIHLQNNQISNLPESIGNIKALRELRLYNNRLEYLPDSFQNLQNLQYLSLSKNNFKEMPHVLFKLKSLKTLDMSENPLSKTEIEKIKKYLPNIKITL